MNLNIKIQTNLIKAISKGEKSLFLYEKGGLVYFTDCGARVFVIPANDFYFQYALFKDSDLPFKIVNDCENNREYEPAAIKYSFKRDGFDYVKIESTSFKCAVNAKLLKEYGKDITLRIGGEKKPVLIKDVNGFAIGIVLPTFIKGEY